MFKLRKQLKLVIIQTQKFNNHEMLLTMSGKYNGSYV